MAKQSMNQEHVTISENATSINTVGDSNQVTVFPISESLNPKETNHPFEVQKRLATPITDRLMLALNAIMAICSVASLVLGGAQLVELLARDDGSWLSENPVPQFWLVFGGIIGLVLVMVGGRFTLWLRKHMYADRILFGKVPEGRADAKGRHRLYLTTLLGTCAVDGAPMRPKRVAMRVVTHYRPDGSIKNTSYHDYRLEMSCSKLGNKDERHRGRVDLSDTQDPSLV